MTMTIQARSIDPVFRSLAFDNIPAPDYADVLIIPLPAGADPDPWHWADAIFSLRSMPGWILALMALRQVLVRAVGIPTAPRTVFQVRAVEDEEALIAFDDAHLDFRCGVGVDAAAALVRVTTVVRLKGWPGRLYFAFVQPLHPLILKAMMRKAARTERLRP